MKRLPMKKIREELEREISAVAELKNEAFECSQLDDYFQLTERLTALHYCQHLLDGDMDLVECYQTGKRPNSHGARFTRRGD